MKNRTCLISVVVLAFSSSPFGFWLESAQARGSTGQGRLPTSHASAHRFSIGSSGPRAMRSQSQPWVNQSTRSEGHSLRGISRFKHRSFKRPHRFHHAPTIYAPPVSEPIEPIVIILTEEENPLDVSADRQITSFPSVHPQIIEERCGKYIQVSWPESGVLAETDSKEFCPRPE